MTQDALENQPPSQTQTAGDVTVSGDENAFALVSAAGNASIDQSHHIIYNYYYREETSAVPVESTVSTDDLPCPYRGLFHFGPNDAAFFFGREVLVTELLQAVQTRAFVPVLGASGSGKSSVVLAGLVPKLQQSGHWQFTHFRPGADPFHALASALVPLYTPALDATEQMRQARKLASYFQDGSLPLGDVIDKIQRNYPNQRVLLIADQFEELYTLCTQEANRRGFLDCLLASLSTAKASTLVLVATMRADFLGNALSYRPFADVLQAGDVKLGAMNREELCQVIEQPAAKLGVKFEAGLSKRILDAVINEPGNLPLLEFALTELWSRRNGRQLTHAAYEAIGEVEGALARYADQQYARLSKLEQEQVRRIFIQLVRPGEGTEDTRRLATKAELGEDRWGLVTQLANSRLVVTSQNGLKQETVEVVHEALIRNWGELLEWMTADRSFRIWQDRLRRAMQQWEEMNHDDEVLLRGAALVEAGELLQQRREDLSAGEQEFIQVSLTLQRRERQRQERHRKLTLLGLTSFSVVALGLAGIASWAWQQASMAQIDTLMKASKLLLESDHPFDSLIASLNVAHRLKRTLWADSNTRMDNTELLQQGVYGVKERYTISGHSSAVNSVVFSSNGKVLVSGSADHMIKLWDLGIGKEIRTLSGHSSEVNSVVFSPNGETLASGSADNTVRLWNVETGKFIRTLSGHSSAVNSVVFSPDGKTLASGSADKTVKLWNVATGKFIRTLSGHSRKVRSVVFSPDGKTLASGSSDKTVKLWDVATGKPIRTLSGHSSSVFSVVFSPNGRTLASSSVDTTVRLWDVKTGKSIRTLSGYSSYVYSVMFSCDGKTLASGSDDNTVRLWDVETGKFIRTLNGHSSSVLSVVFSPDCKTLASGSSDKTVELWDMTTGKFIRTLIGHSSSVESVMFNSDGKTLVSGSDDSTVKLWDVTTGKPIRTFIGHSNKVRSVAFSPNGKTLVSGSDDSTVKLWDVTTGKPIRTFIGHRDSVYSVVFSPNGKTLASCSDDKTVKLWDITTGKPIRTFIGHKSYVNSVVFSPNGETLASGGDDSTVKLWDVTTGKLIRTLSGHGSSVYSVVFSPNGETLASGSDDKTVKLWDVTTGKLIRTLSGHSGSLRSVVFSADSRILASGSRDKTVRLWDVATGKSIHALSGYTNPVNSVVFSPDGKTMASGSADGVISLWQLDINFDPDILRKRGCSWVHNYLQNNPNVSASDRHMCDGVVIEP